MLVLLVRIELSARWLADAELMSIAMGGLQTDVTPALQRPIPLVLSSGNGKDCSAPAALCQKCDRSNVGHNT